MRGRAGSPYWYGSWVDPLDPLSPYNNVDYNIDFNLEIQQN